jgi:hypothetical protein
MNRTFYVSGLSSLLVIILILFLLPMFIVYVVLPLLILFLIISLIRRGITWLRDLFQKKNKNQSGPRYKKLKASDQIIDV